MVGDGLKVSKAGKKMPAVKRLHQQSDSNTKPEYIMGHSCQAIAILAGALEGVFAIPLVSRIHEGLVFSNRDKRTLLDKMVLLVNSPGITEKPFAENLAPTTDIFRSALLPRDFYSTFLRLSQDSYGLISVLGSALYDPASVPPNMSPPLL